MKTALTHLLTYSLARHARVGQTPLARLLSNRSKHTTLEAAIMSHAGDVRIVVSAFVCAYVVVYHFNL